MSFLGNIFRKPEPAKGGRGKGSGRATRSKSSGRGKAAAPPPPPAPRGMSLDRKLDIAGIILVVIGVVTLFSLFTPNTSPLLDAVLNAMAQLAGAGR